MFYFNAAYTFVYKKTSHLHYVNLQLSHTLFVMQLLSPAAAAASHSVPYCRESRYVSDTNLEWKQNFVAVCENCNVKQFTSMSRPLRPSEWQRMLFERSASFKLIDFYTDYSTPVIASQSYSAMNFRTNYPTQIWVPNQGTHSNLLVKQNWAEALCYFAVIIHSRQERRQTT